MAGQPLWAAVGLQHPVSDPQVDHVTDMGKRHRVLVLLPNHMPVAGDPVPIDPPADLVADLGQKLRAAGAIDTCDEAVLCPLGDSGPSTARTGFRDAGRVQSSRSMRRSSWPRRVVASRFTRNVRLLRLPSEPT